MQVRAQKEQMMWEALKDAIDEEMEMDPTVCMMGKTCSPDVFLKGIT